MKLKCFVIHLLIFVGFIAPVFAQKSLQGKVIEVLDGKTIIVETPEKNKFILQLQYLEVPNSEHSISKTVKDHLHKMLFEKTVQFNVWSTSGNKNICFVTLNKIDISQQLIRDGAGWYDFSAEPKPTETENSEYQKMENAAKSEKRGVWADLSIKPSWQIKAEKDAEQQRLAQIAADEKAATNFDKKRIAREKANARVEMWAEVPVTEQQKSNDADNIFNPNREITFEYDEFQDSSYAFSPTMILRGDQGYGNKLLCFKYFYQGNVMKKGGSQFEIAISSDSSDEIFFLTTKGERFAVGTGYKPPKSAISIYKVDRNVLSKLSTGDYAYMKVGVSKYTLDAAMLGAIRRLLKAT